MTVPTTFPPSVQRARTLVRPRPEASLGLFDWARVVGRVVEVSEAGAFGALSALVSLLVQVQARGEQIVWVEAGTSIFYAPDLAFRGLDVGALTVVGVPDPLASLQAADSLLRSGAFGLVVIDGPGVRVDEAALGRLARLAEDRQTAVVFLTRKRPDEASLATQVSLRGVVTLGPGLETSWEVTKDKRSGPAFPQRTRFDGPFGLY